MINVLKSFGLFMVRYVNYQRFYYNSINIPYHKDQRCEEHRRRFFAHEHTVPEAMKHSSAFLGRFVHITSYFNTNNGQITTQ
jgi:hypothetical protein